MLYMLKTIKKRKKVEPFEHQILREVIRKKRHIKWLMNLKKDAKN